MIAAVLFASSKYLPLQYEPDHLLCVLPPWMCSNPDGKSPGGFYKFYSDIRTGLQKKKKKWYQVEHDKTRINADIVCDMLCYHYAT